MQPEIKNINGVDHLIIAVPLQEPEISQNGKSKIVAKTGFVNTALQVNKKPITYTLCAFIPLK